MVIKLSPCLSQQPSVSNQHGLTGYLCLCWSLATYLSTKFSTISLSLTWTMSTLETFSFWFVLVLIFQRNNYAAQMWWHFKQTPAEKALPLSTTGTHLNNVCMHQYYNITLHLSFWLCVLYHCCCRDIHQPI